MCSGVFSTSSRRCARYSVTACAITIGASSSAPHWMRSCRPSRTPRTGSSASSKRTANSSTAASSPGGSTMAAARRTSSASVIWLGSIGMETVLPRRLQLDHAPDAVLVMHQLEAVVDLVERDPVRDERVDVQITVEVALDELRDLVAALDAAERRAADAPAGDLVAR